MSDDARDLYRPPDPPRVDSKWCELCGRWCDHFADSHRDDIEEADPVFVAERLVEARQKLGGK